MTSIGSAKTEARQSVLIVEDDQATSEAPERDDRHG
jgi:hypothetical protein